MVLVNTTIWYLMAFIGFRTSANQTVNYIFRCQLVEGTPLCIEYRVYYYVVQTCRTWWCGGWRAAAHRLWSPSLRTTTTATIWGVTDDINSNMIHCQKNYHSKCTHNISIKYYGHFIIGINFGQVKLHCEVWINATILFFKVCNKYWNEWMLSKGESRGRNKFYFEIKTKLSIGFSVKAIWRELSPVPVLTTVFYSYHRAMKWEFFSVT